MRDSNVVEGHFDERIYMQQLTIWDINLHIYIYIYIHIYIVISHVTRVMSHYRTGHVELINGVRVPHPICIQKNTTSGTHRTIPTIGRI